MHLKQRLGVGNRQPERLGNPRIYNFAFHNIESKKQAGILAARVFPPLAGEPLGVRQRRISER